MDWLAVWDQLHAPLYSVPYLKASKSDKVYEEAVPSVCFVYVSMLLRSGPP